LVTTGIDHGTLAELHPSLYHMAEPGSWDSILRNGLLSTSALLDLFDIRGDQREALEGRHRPTSMRIQHRVHGQAWIRDQKPMDDAGLIRALAGSGIAVGEWHKLLNRHVFFWPTRSRLVTMLSARAYRDKTHLVLTVDTASLLQRHWRQIRLSPINSGATKPMPQPRGGNTFRKPADYPYEELRRRRGPLKAIAEVAVLYSVPSIQEIVVEAAMMKGDLTVSTLFKR
jgi:hypothetical protein